MLDLIHGALARRFIGAVADDLRSMTEPAAGEMIVGHLDDDLRIDRFPFAGSFRTPTTRSARRVAGKPWWLSERFVFLRQRGTIGCFKRGGESDVMKQAVVIVETEQ